MDASLLYIHLMYISLVFISLQCVLCHKHVTNKLNDLLLVELSEQLEANPSPTAVKTNHSTQLHLIL